MCSADKPSTYVIVCVTHDGLGRCESANYIAFRALSVSHGTCGVFTRMRVLFSLFKSEKRTQNGSVPGRFRSRPRGGASPLPLASRWFARGKRGWEWRTGRKEENVCAKPFAYWQYDNNDSSNDDKGARRRRRPTRYRIPAGETVAIKHRFHGSGRARVFYHRTPVEYDMVPGADDATAAIGRFGTVGVTKRAGPEKALG